MRRNILVTSATGNQASGLIRSFLPPTSGAPFSNPASPTTTIPLSPIHQSNGALESEEHEYHIYALTRRAYSTSPQDLGVRRSEQNRLRIVQGDLDDRRSVEKVFKDVKEKDGGFWGVLVVLPFPGLGVDASGEERQGKMLADLALQYGVTSFIYSSAMRLGEKYETEQYLKFSSRAKVRIEEYVVGLGDKGLAWTILQPGFFMENFEGFKGSLAVSILKKGLKPSTTISFVAAEDVGNLAAAIFQDHETHKHSTILVVSQFVTLAQIEDAHLTAIGRPLPSAPKAVGWGLNKGSSKTRELMVKGLQLNHKCRSEGDYKEIDEEMEKARRVIKLQSYAEWKAKHR